MSINTQHIRKYVETHAVVVEIVVDDLIEELGTVGDGTMKTGNSLRVRRPLVRSLDSITLVSVNAPWCSLQSLGASHRSLSKPDRTQKQVWAK